MVNFPQQKLPASTTRLCQSPPPRKYLKVVDYRVRVVHVKNGVAYTADSNRFTDHSRSLRGVGALFYLEVRVRLPLFCRRRAFGQSCALSIKKLGFVHAMEKFHSYVAVAQYIVLARRPPCCEIDPKLNGSSPISDRSPAHQ